MRAESLIFDVDGTLWDVRDIVARAWNRVMVREGYPDRFVTGESLTGLFGKTAGEIAALVFPGDPRGYGLLLKCLAEEDALMAQTDAVSGYPGTVETMERLARHHRLFIVTNGGKGYPQQVMGKLGMTHLFSGSLCHGETGTSKGETIRTLMARHSITSAVYIGDTLGDQQASDLAGLPFIWAAYGFGTPEHYDAKLEKITDLPALMEDPL